MSTKTKTSATTTPPTKSNLVATAKQNAAAKVNAASAAATNAAQTESPSGQSSEYFRNFQVKNAKGQLVPKPVVVIEEKGRLRTYWAGPDGKKPAGKPQLVLVEGPPMILNPKGNMILEGNVFFKGDNYTVGRSQAKFGIGLNQGLTTPEANSAFGGIEDLKKEQADFIEFIYLLNKAIVRSAFYCASTNEHLKKERIDFKQQAEELIAASKHLKRADLLKKIKLNDAEGKKLQGEINAKACELFVNKSRKLEGDPSTKNDEGEVRDPMVWLDQRVYHSKWSENYDESSKGPSELELPSSNENMQKAIEAMHRLDFKYNPIRWRFANSTALFQRPKVKFPMFDATGRPLLDDQRKQMMREDTDYECCPGTKSATGVPVHSLVSCKSIWSFGIYQGGHSAKGSVSGDVIIWHRTEQSQSKMSTYNFAGLGDVDDQAPDAGVAPSTSLQDTLDGIGGGILGKKDTNKKRKGDEKIIETNKKQKTGNKTNQTAQKEEQQEDAEPTDDNGEHQPENDEQPADENGGDGDNAEDGANGDDVENNDAPTATEDDNDEQQEAGEDVLAENENGAQEEDGAQEDEEPTAPEEDDAPPSDE